MSDHQKDETYWHRVDAVANLANEQCVSADPNDVGASTLFAAARFNAFVLAKMMGTGPNLALERDQALAYFTDQFNKMMAANLDDFITNFDQYMKPQQ